jgi:hypothetical protein
MVFLRELRRKGLEAVAKARRDMKAVGRNAGVI